MASIPGSSFWMGTDATKIPEIAKAFGIEKHPDLISTETPRHRVTIRPFYLDKYEVTNVQFRKFIHKHRQWSVARMPKQFENGNYLKGWSGNDFPKGKVNFPVVNVSWFAAVAYCQSVGKRLPTEAEWEFAARGGLVDQIFPWGNEQVDASRANYGGSKLGAASAVGSYAPNGYGLFDMSGNVWEFMADEWQPYTEETRFDPVAGGDRFLSGSYLMVKTRRVIRGGSWGGAPLNLRVTYRDSHPADGARDFVGFRCAK
ncbi:MAG: SUMF1/EgtB/PvdO family nonheme iron enzyme [Acidobacteriota bacterium]